jgi:tryptophan synthase alpha chain
VSPSRLTATFDALRARGEKGLVTYVTAGDPDLSRSAAVIRAIAGAGADVIEVGVPFSDPLADGPVIQRATERALQAGTTLAGTLALVASLRGAIAPPIVLFSYVNPILRMGLQPFVDRAADAGVDGVLLLDLPIEESDAVRAALDRRGLDQIFLVSPTTTDARLAEAARLGRGFLYAISRLGVTGTRDTVAATAEPLAARIRAKSRLPLALGFGIARPEHVRQVWTYADAAVVGSAIVSAIGTAAADGGDPATAAADLVSQLLAGGTSVPPEPPGLNTRPPS